MSVFSNRGYIGAGSAGGGAGSAGGGAVSAGAGSCNITRTGVNIHMGSL